MPKYQVPVKYFDLFCFPAEEVGINLNLWQVRRELWKIVEIKAEAFLFLRWTEQMSDKIRTKSATLYQRQRAVIRLYVCSVSTSQFLQKIWWKYSTPNFFACPVCHFLVLMMSESKIHIFDQLSALGTVPTSSDAWKPQKSMKTVADRQNGMAQKRYRRQKDRVLSAKGSEFLHHT